jgi:hypothetical protein
MGISPACQRTIETWESFSVELRERILRLAESGFVIHSIEIAPERNGTRFVQVFACQSFDGGMQSTMWWQMVPDQREGESAKCLR